jgi:hypothetical protein
MLQLKGDEGGVLEEVGKKLGHRTFMEEFHGHRVTVRQLVVGAVVVGQEGVLEVLVAEGDPLYRCKMALQSQTTAMSSNNMWCQQCL